MATTTPIGSLVVKAQRSVLAGVKPHRDLATREGAQLLSCVQHAIDGAADLHEGVTERLAALARDLLGEVIASVLHEAATRRSTAMRSCDFGQPSRSRKARVAASSFASSAAASSIGISAIGSRSNACTICSMLGSPVQAGSSSGAGFLSSSIRTRVFSA